MPRVSSTARAAATAAAVTASAHKRTRSNGTTDDTLTDAPTSTEAVHLAETLLEECPHTGREVEYEAVVSYVARRWSHDANTGLFVCGGCGCGKTSTIKRALRAMSARVLPCDATGRSLVKRSSFEERGWSLTPSTAAATAEPAAAVASATGDMTLIQSRDLATPRPSQQFGSEAAGLTPPPSSLASALSHNTTPDTPTRVTAHAMEWEAGKALFSGSSSPVSARHSASSEDSTASALAAATGNTMSDPPKRRRMEDSEAAAEGKSSSAGMRTRRQTRLSSSIIETAAPPCPIVPYSFEYFHTRYPEVFPDDLRILSKTPPFSRTQTTRTAAASIAPRSLYGHYVNCADMSGPLLVEAIAESIQATCTRADVATQVLLQQLTRIGGKCTTTMIATSTQSTRSAASNKLSKLALHVVALDEVEYVRGGGAKTLAQLAELAFQLPGQLALIFVSNQRAFVHVPQMMLEALLFEPYSEEQLKRIGANATTAELQRCAQIANASRGTPVNPGTTGAAGTRKKAGGSSLKNASAAQQMLVADVDIKPRLYDYIARKALLEYSGDVRQVIAMCHRVVSVAWQEVLDARRAEATLPNTGHIAGAQRTSSTGTGELACGRRSAAAANAPAVVPATDLLPSKLEAAVDDYQGSSTRGNGVRGAGSCCASARSSTSLAGAVATVNAAPESNHGTTAVPARSAATSSNSSGPSASSTTGVMTLAKSVRLLQSNQIESEIDKHVGTLPEQTLYVLSCIVVLSLRKQEERKYASSSVGGRIGTSRTPNAGVATAQRAAPTLALKMHEVHQLYTRLMAELHFPAMRADGFPLQVECLADFGVLTRPQLRGTDRIFSLNGTWTLPAMQAALVKRGEAIKQDRLAAGAEAVIENKFEEVLRELARLMKY